MGLAFGILCMYVGYKVYRRFCLTPFQPRKKRRKERQALNPGTSVDMLVLHMPVVGESLKCLECQHHTLIPAPKQSSHDFCQTLPPRAVYTIDFYPSQALPPRASRGRRAAFRSSPWMARCVESF